MERPILFNGDMVRAILEGKKTQTRRLVKPQPIQPYPDQEPTLWRIPNGLPIGEATCPIAQPGDLLWVRETWGRLLCANGYSDEESRCLDCQNCRNAVTYQATDPNAKDREDIAKWRPSIHMPRGASRITLSVTSVRVERLNSISNADAKAEGVKSSSPCGGCGEDRWGNCIGCRHPWTDVPRVAFQELWLSVYGEGSLDANPWVWVIEFEVQK